MTIKHKDLAEFLRIRQELISALANAKLVIKAYLSLLESQEGHKEAWANYQEELRTRLEDVEERYQDLAEFVDE